MLDMPNVIYVDEMDANWSAKQWDESDHAYLRVPADIDPDDAVVVSGEILGERAVQEQMYLDRIADLEAERDAARKQTAELVEAVELIKETIAAHEIESLDCDGTDADYCDCLIANTNRAVALAAQLKEQDDD